MFPFERSAVKVGRGYVAIRREEGKSDVVKHFPHTATEFDAIDWCEADGYEVIHREIIETPDDPKYSNFTIVKVQPNSHAGWKRVFAALRSSLQFPKPDA
jgi:hypothetical protein